MNLKWSFVRIQLLTDETRQEVRQFSILIINNQFFSSRPILYDSFSYVLVLKGLNNHFFGYRLFEKSNVFGRRMNPGTDLSPMLHSIVNTARPR